MNVNVPMALIGFGSRIREGFGFAIIKDKKKDPKEDKQKEMKGVRDWVLKFINNNHSLFSSYSFYYSST